MQHCVMRTSRCLWEAWQDVAALELVLADEPLAEGANRRREAVRSGHDR
jgi:hypothetical protein